MVTVKCDCGANLKVKDNSAGKTLKCPKCNAEITAPLSLGEGVPIAPAPVAPKNARKNRAIKFSYPSVVATIALIISLVALFRNPLGSGIENYDLSTPESALRFSVAIITNDDLQARIDYNFLPIMEQFKEKLETLKIHKSSDYNSDKILWISFDKNGIKQYDIEVLKKEPKSGLWYVDAGGKNRIYDTTIDKAGADWISKSGTVEE